MSEDKKIITREEVKDEDKWNVESLYPTLSDFEKELNSYKDMKKIDDFVKKYKGNLKKLSGKEFCALYDDFYGMERILSKLYVYSSLRNNEDHGNDTNKANYKIIQEIYTKFSSKLAWMDPEIVELDEKKQKEILTCKEMEKYKVIFERTIRMKEHTKSKEIEEVLANCNRAFSSSRSIYNAISDTDFVFGKVKDKDGVEKVLTHGSFYTYIKSKDRVLRKNAFVQLHKKYEEFKNTLTEVYNFSVQTSVLLSNTRGYKSALDRKLFPNNIPKSVYTNLVDATKEGIDALHDYISLKKEIMEVDELHLYDLYVPLIELKTEKKYSFDEAVELTIKSAEPLGKEYVKLLEKGLKEERWVDRYENKGKHSGAFSHNHYDSYPFILMNFEGDLESVFTLVHEGGHSMHSLLSDKNNEYHYADYTLFVAEVASIFNECNLTDYLLKNSKSKKEKLIVLNKMIENFRTTFFRQVLFADFELQVHTFVEKGTPLTPKLLKETYYNIYKYYYNDKLMVIDEEISHEWSRIPHFFLYGYYVYQYATGITAAIYLSEKVRNGGEKERENYLNFLKAGSSRWPVDILKKAGIDLTQKQVFLEAIKNFKKNVAEFKQLYKEYKEEEEKKK